MIKTLTIKKKKKKRKRKEKVNNLKYIQKEPKLKKREISPPRFELRELLNSHVRHLSTRLPLISFK